VDQTIADALEKATDKRGMTQISMMSRMVKWLASQDAEIQIKILNESAPTRAVTSAILKKLADGADGRPKKKG
jgi:hypothetical protein